MATIKRNGAHTYLADSTASVGIINRGTEGLRFQFTVTDERKGYQYTVALSHVERDHIIATWAKLERDFEGGS